MRITSYFLHLVLLLTTAFTLHVNGQNVVVAGAKKVASGSTSCYTATSPSGCTTNAGYCWGITGGTASSGGCVINNVIINTVVPNGSPGGNGCNGPANFTAHFNTVASLTSATVTATNSCGYSNSYIVTVVPALTGSITVSPSSQAIIAGAAYTTLSASAPSGGDGTYSYQWQQSSDNSTWSNINGATSSTYTPSGVSTGSTMYFQVIVSSFTYTLTSNPSAVSVYPPVVPGSLSLSNAGANVTVTCSGASGGNGTYSYQWQSSTDGSNWSAISGATSLSYTGTPTVSTYYRIGVTSVGSTVYSSSAYWIVYPPVVAGTITPGTVVINYNTSPGTLTCTSATGGNGTYSYQWESSPDNNNWTAINGATALSYTPGALTATTYYRLGAPLYNASGKAYSNVVTVTVYPPLLAGSISPTTQSISYNTVPAVLSASGATGGNGSYTYQWLSSPSVNGTYTPISGATGSSYAPPALATTMFYELVITSNGVSVTTGPVAINVAVDSDNFNYIRERGISKPGVIDKPTADLLGDPNDVKQTTQYFDGLGRPIQTVAWQATPLGKDMVATQVYDLFGREATRYMPYIAPSADGLYKLNALTEQQAFNVAQFPNEQYYYSQITFEASPLNRPMTSYTPGSSWVGAGRGVSMGYLLNTDDDNVQNWTIAAAAGSLPVSIGAYPAGQLFKNVTTDEQGHQVVEYKDKQGMVVLKKVQLAASPGTAHVGWLCTYNVYDAMSNLRFVLQPLAVQLINSNWTLTQAIADELCFRYEYDYRRRMYIKKTPGAGEVRMVYDMRDRLVMTQDANLRSQEPAKWQVMEYDSQNRPRRTGLLTDNNNQAYHQNLASGSSSYPNTSTNYEVLSQTYYDDYSWVGGTGTALTASLDLSAIGSNLISSYNTSPLYAQSILQYLQTRGVATGSMIKVLNSSPAQYLYSVNFYDDRGRVIQSQAINVTGGRDVVTNQYDFNGKLLRSLTLHQKAGSNTQSHTVLTKLEYDAMGHPTKTWKNIDGAGTDQLINTLQYNELSQLQNKALGNGVENLACEYNIRGWLLSINKNYINGTSNNNYFGLELGYDKPASAAGTTSYTNPQYNGNIEGTVWKSKGDGVNRKYDFTYDNVNRLSGANFVQNTSGSTWDNGLIDFTVSNLSYDANGNILSMNQKGFKLNGSALIDQLTYTYQPNSNKLSQVNDGSNDPNSTLGDFHYNGTKQTTDYNYDGNGNLVLDNNKAISGIAYNYLDLPQQVTVTAKGNVQYVYDAAGNKLQKITTDNTVTPAKTTITSYIGGFVYQNDTLQFISHEEGRARWAFHKYMNGNTGYGFEYDFFLKDHLGNVRMVLTQQKDTAQYVATMEAAYRNIENALFYNLPACNYPTASVPGGYPSDATTTPNDSLMRLNGSGQKVGAAIVLKVMAGDVVDIAVKSFYRDQSSTGTSSSLNDVLNSLANGIVGIVGSSKGALADLNNSSSPLYAALSSFATPNNPDIPNKPKAYLNWVLLDEQFKYSGNPPSGAIGVGNYPSNQINTLANSGINVTKSGYLYIYVNNETQGWDVFFDNLSIKHYTGPMLEETHYYPFGLAMAGISSKAIKSNYAENRYKANGGDELQSKEFSDGSGLDFYDATFRGYDAQIGRFMQQDPLADIDPDWSPYTYVHNNPLAFSDPLGLTDSTGVPAGRPDEATPAVVVYHKANCRTCSIPANNPNSAKGAPDFIKPGPPPVEDVLPEAAVEATTEAAATTATVVETVPVWISLAVPIAIIGGILIIDHFFPSLQNPTNLPSTTDLPKFNPRIIPPLHAPPTWEPVDDPNKAPLRIALGADNDLLDFAVKTSSIPYGGWGIHMPGITTPAAYTAAIIRLGRIPGTTFHFNLTTPKGLVNSPVNLQANANSILTAEYITVKTLFSAQTTFYTKSGSTYKPTTKF